jgi:hypothetical protein
MAFAPFRKVFAALGSGRYVTRTPPRSDCPIRPTRHTTRASRRPPTRSLWPVDRWVLVEQLGELGQGRPSSSRCDADRRMNDRQVESLCGLHSRDDVREQQVMVHRADACEVRRPVINHEQRSVLRREQVIPTASRRGRLAIRDASARRGRGRAGSTASPRKPRSR